MKISEKSASKRKTSFNLSPLKELLKIAMPRGSKPGERRGGRQKGTPNKKTALANIAITAAAAKPHLSPLDLFLSMMWDQALAITTRVAMAQRALPYIHAKLKGDQSEQPDLQKHGAPTNAGSAPKKSNSVSGKKAAAMAAIIASEDPASIPDRSPLSFLLHVMRDPKTPAGLRVKVACITAPYVHPKRANNRPTKNGVTPTDRLGFVVDPAATTKLRDDKLRLQRLLNRRIKHPDDYNRKAPPLEARIAAAAKELNCPCPSMYGMDDIEKDYKRLGDLSRKRRSRSKLTKEEDAEEALLTTRLSALAAGPENQARVRRKELERRRRVSLGGGPPLSLAEESELRGLTTLYPKMLPRRSEEIILFDSAFNDALHDTAPDT